MTIACLAAFALDPDVASSPVDPSFVDRYIQFLPWVMVGVILVSVLYLRYRRQQSLKALAESHHLEWLGSRLPPDFPAEMLGKLGSWYHFGGWRGSENVISGMEGNDRLLAFDAVIGRGRGRFEQTWVARRVAAPSHPPDISGPLLYREAGPWRAVARKPRLLGGTRMNSSSIEEIWQRLL
jgi:hypothetical protein